MPPTARVDSLAPLSASCSGADCAGAPVSAGGAPLQVVTATDQRSSAPVSPLLSSSTLSVQAPLGFSPAKAPSASSGTRGDSTALFWKVLSVTGPGGLASPASSSQSVPRKTLLRSAALSAVRV